MAKMFNRARMTVTSTGTGALSLGVAVAGYQTFSSAGAQNNDVVSYAVEDGLKWEIGTGTYNSVAGTLSRTVTQSFDGTTYGTSAISVTTSAQVFISPLAADLQYGTSAGNLVQLDGSARLPAVDGSLVTALNASNISSGILGVARGGTGLTSLTAGYIPFGNGTGAFSNSANFTYDGTNVVATAPAGVSRFRIVNGTDVADFAYSGSNLYLSSSSAAGSMLFQTANTERMRIIPAGFVGIGINPSFQLDVLTTSNNGLRISDGTQTGIMFPSGLGGLAVGTTSNHPLIFLSNNAERMRIATDGSVGIGTTSLTPTYGNYRLFSVNGSSGAHIKLNTSDVEKASFVADINSLYITSATKISFGIGTGAPSPASMLLDASGNLGLGTTSPSYKLDVAGNSRVYASSAGQNVFYIGANRANDYAFVNFQCYPQAVDGYTIGGFNAYSSLATFGTQVGNLEWTKSGAGTDNKTTFKIMTHDGTSLATALFIDANRNVGIGTTSPSYKLDVNGVMNVAGNVIHRIGGVSYVATSGNYTYFYNNTNGINWQNSSDTATLMRLDSSGNFLVTGGGGLGYGTGSGGTVTQATDKATGVTLNKTVGRITTSNAALAAGATVTFTLTNSLIAVNDVIVISVDGNSTANGSSYNVWALVGSGAAYFNIRNIGGSSLSDIIYINFAIIKGATS